MIRQAVVVAIFAIGGLASTRLSAGDPIPSLDDTRAAIARAIPLLEKGTAGSAEQRECFTCHNQAAPVLALVEAKHRGFDVDDGNRERQLQHTAAHLERGREGYLEGKGQGGQVLTAGFALWTLEAGGRHIDDTTAAVAGYLLAYQSDKDHWEHRGRRPPSSGSDFTATYVALRSLSAFGTEEQKSAIAARVEGATQWLLTEKPADTEDRVFRLLALKHVGADDQTIQNAVAELTEDQRDDGGWAQKADMLSDAYATATVLYALLQAGGVPREAANIDRGVRYLIGSQCDDGSWHVVTRAEPFQTYYESGYPHGADQFISIAASSWATYALLLTLPESH